MLRKRTLPQQIFTYSMLVLMAVVILFPIYFRVIVSLKSSKDIYRTPSLLPVNPITRNYTELFLEEGFLNNIKNSLIVSGGATLVSLIFSCMAAYSLVRLRYRFRDWFGRLILFTYLTPSALLFIPLSVIIARLQLSNTLHGLVFVYLTFSAPLSTWLLMGYFRSIPVDLEEQAMVDGATRFQAFFRITLPLAVPGLIAVGVFTFTAAWNELLFALLFITKQ
jgi:multiple sugar transport system permease protein